MGLDSIHDCASSNNSEQDWKSIEEQISDLDMDLETQSYLRREGYAVLKKIGQGGYGKVYMVQDDSGQVSALKLLDRRGKSCPEVVWLTQEFKMAKMMLDDSMQHPNLLSPRKLFGNHECRCIVTNYAPLGDLDHELYNQGPLKEIRVRSIGRQLLEALQHLHERDFVHRDVKPGNILCFQGGRIQLGDFGAAGRHMGAQHGPHPGTYVYMAPELFVRDCTGQAFYNHKVDLFSAGVSLYELATGEMPFAGSTADEVVNEQLSFPVCYPPTLSAELRALLEALLHINPEKRLDYLDLWKLPFWTAMLDHLRPAAPQNLHTATRTTGGSLPGLKTVLQQLGVLSASSHASTTESDMTTNCMPLSKPFVRPRPAVGRLVKAVQPARLPKIPLAVRPAKIQKQALAPPPRFSSPRYLQEGGPVRKARGPAPVALNSPAGLPTMRTSAGSVQSMTQQRIVVSGDMASMRSSTSESLIGLAGINNLELLETQHPQPQEGRRALARLGPMALPKLPTKSKGGRKALACLGPMPLPLLPHQLPQLATLQMPTAVSAVLAVPTTSAATHASAKSERDVADSAYSGIHASSNHCTTASSRSRLHEAPYPAVPQLGVPFPEVEPAQQGLPQPAPANDALLALEHVIAEMQAQQAVMQQTLMSIQVQMQQQQAALATLAAEGAVHAERPQGGHRGRVRQLARACQWGLKRVFGSLNKKL